MNRAWIDSMDMDDYDVVVSALADQCVMKLEEIDSALKDEGASPEVRRECVSGALDQLYAAIGLLDDFIPELAARYGSKTSTILAQLEKETAAESATA